VAFGVFYNPLVCPTSAPPHPDAVPSSLSGDAAHAMPPFLGQGANQAIQDGYCLAAQLAAIGTRHASLDEALAAYERIRKFPTAKLTLNSWFLGFLETQRGLGAVVRDKFFNTMYRVGVAQFVFLDGATPKIGDD
jgi:salicylate hydroxylase